MSPNLEAKGEEKMNPKGVEVTLSKEHDAEACAIAETEEESEPKTIGQIIGDKVSGIWATHSFLVMVVFAIIIAWAYPPLGADYLQPQVTATWVAVMIIFILAGLGLKTEELSKAFQRWRFNAFVQIFNFMVDSSIVFGISRALFEAGALARSLADGMVITACLPLTINMVLVLTSSSGGDESAAVFNAAFGNLVGVFLSPALIFMYLGVEGDVKLTNVFFKLGLRVVLPIFIGQMLHIFYKPAVEWQKKHKKKLKKVQEGLLSFIVYTVFCKTFDGNTDASLQDGIVMVALVFVVLCLLMSLSWLAFGLPFTYGKSPKLRVMGLFGCTHKTVAMGVPLINAIYEDNVNVGLYTLPLLVWHPMQLLIGTSISSKLAAFVEREEKRLNEE
mmetsp:Transcript_11381/g.17090  ORF Transcript_11381/g.17090 Transcript_11381/m.17090 type:complete len:389 (-) Transcript_11381:51-1217(-)|eukprot:CAMPEP_0196816564 /NCGR_PEP_ID=MMETSP1362-20130617/56048_1 /TAXON_ID=163516 /ORGANISM="Leptocylindrus danicus, Strain CCMP1856" /LENGTH=388 /DNA_ID=CAMNT_0042193955 /DNA_START=50 /DNA_END=1216 /DNA_ORIENTATION=+